MTMHILWIMFSIQETKLKDALDITLLSGKLLFTFHYWARVKYLPIILDTLSSGHVLIA